LFTKPWRSEEHPADNERKEQLDMKRLLWLVTVLVLFAASGALVYAQSAEVNIDFPFTVAGKALPAGKYTVEMPDANSIAVRGAAGAGVMVVLTQLGRHDKDKDLELVFDKVGDAYLLSEVWFPDQDGYLLLSTKEAHSHAVLGGSNPRK
jgi:hypothetical protein